MYNCTCSLSGEICDANICGWEDQKGRKSAAQQAMHSHFDIVFGPDLWMTYYLIYSGYFDKKHSYHFVDRTLILIAVKIQSHLIRTSGYSGGRDMVYCTYSKNPLQMFKFMFYSVFLDLKLTRSLFLIHFSYDYAKPESFWRQKVSYVDVSLILEHM